MGIFSKNKNKNELMLVFNIGSSSVEGALFLAQSSGVPKIIFSTSEQIQLEDKIDIDRFYNLAMQSLEIVAGRIYKAGLGAPKEIFCVLSSPWHVSQTRIINYKKNTPFVFTAKLAESLIKKETELFEEEHLKNKVSGAVSNRIIELKNIKTTLNGYETAEPINQKVQELEIIIFISMSEEETLKKIEDTISKSFHFNKIRFCSFTLSSFTVVRGMYPKQENFLLLDVGGEVTNVAMVKKNILHESISFPSGRNFLTRGVASSLGCTLNEANSLISLLKDGHAEKSVVEKLETVMNQLKAKWLKQFQESLVNISNDISIPSTIYMTADKDLADFFCQTIKSEQFNQYTLTESKFEIVFLDLPMFLGISVFKDVSVDKTSLVIDSIYINRFLTKI
jgi:hypothetical protein